MNGGPGSFKIAISLLIAVYAGLGEPSEYRMPKLASPPDALVSSSSSYAYTAAAP